MLENSKIFVLKDAENLHTSYEVAVEESFTTGKV
jgi:hypothetical protein